jgi:hypothetical protein
VHANWHNTDKAAVAEKPPVNIVDKPDHASYIAAASFAITLVLPYEPLLLINIVHQYNNCQWKAANPNFSQPTGYFRTNKLMVLNCINAVTYKITLIRSISHKNYTYSDLSISTHQPLTGTLDRFWQST